MPTKATNWSGGHGNRQGEREGGLGGGGGGFNLIAICRRLGGAVGWEEYLHLHPSFHPFSWGLFIYAALYYPTLLRRVQITCDICTRLIPPTARKIKNLDKSEILGKRKRWIINLLLEILMCSIAVMFYSSFVF